MGLYGRITSAPLLRRSHALLVAALLTVAVVWPATAASAAAPQRTAVIVQLVDGSDAAGEARLAAGSDGRVSHVFSSALQGFAAELPSGAIAALQHNPRVAGVEPDAVVTATDMEPNATWGLDRIDQRGLPLSGSYNFRSGAGTGVTAYIIDTGVSPVADFAKLLPGYDAVTPGGNGTGDCNGHGTHVAGTVAGTTYGVAKAAAVVPVRVLDCSGAGTVSGVIAGLDWVTAHHTPGPAVVNMSLGGPASSTVDAAVQRVIDDGVTVAVAAGNSNASACSVSPARVPAALTVGATDIADRRAFFSNFGPCVDLFAPGVNITSDWLDDGNFTLSGTSMATPHVTGAAAVLLSEHPGMTPAQVASQLVSQATKDEVSGAGSKSPNRLLYSPPGSPKS